MTAVTKSGTNVFHVDATGYWKPNSLQSHTVEENCSCPLGQTGFNLGKMRDMTIHAGGPLVQNRLWYFVGVQDYVFTNAEPGTYLPQVATDYWYRAPAKLTWQVNDSLKVTGLLHLEWWGGYASGPTLSVASAAATKTLQAHIHTYASQADKTFGSGTLLTIRVGGLWEPNLLTGPVSGDYTTPSHTDLLTGYVCCGAPSSGRSVFRRDTQSVKLERYVARSGMTHTFQGGFQLEEVKDLRETTWPSNVQYYDYGGAPDYALFSGSFGAGRELHDAGRMGGGSVDARQPGDGRLGPTIRPPARRQSQSEGHQFPASRDRCDRRGTGEPVRVELPGASAGG